ncbi:MAG: Hpt domain-containing protein [bacterium]|nr:Hpt domain-containing protein [bacterium]
MFNLDEALARSGGDASLLCELIDLFMEILPERLSAMQESLAADDYESLAHLAHALKGSAGAIGAQRVFEGALGLETAGKAGNIEESVRMLEQLKKEINAFRTLSSEWQKGFDR